MKTDDQLIADFLRTTGARVATGRLDYGSDLIMKPSRYSRPVQSSARAAQKQRRKIIEALPRVLTKDRGKG